MSGNPKMAEEAQKAIEEQQALSDDESPEALDPNDSNLLRDQLKGVTTEHASPPRLEDEGQSGG